VADTAAVQPKATWLFLTRKGPPAVGGMETLSHEVTTRLAMRRPVRVVARGDESLARFLVRAATRLVVECRARRLALVHIGDAVLAPLGIVPRLFGVATAVNLHGLDVTYDAPVYAMWRRMFLRRFDRFICISEATRDAAVARGVPAAATAVIGIGVDPQPLDETPRDDATLLFVGRLVPRKGLRWFVANVFARLRADRPALRLVVIGYGPERAVLEADAACRAALPAIVWVGAAPEPDKRGWLARATIAVMPNVPLAGDMEGFGIVALEAAAHGCPLVAADLEGLRDAVVDGVSGVLVEAGDADAWCRAVAALLDDPVARSSLGESARRHVANERGWDPIIDRYERVLQDAVDARTR